jgi:hypothetical protein
MNTTGQKLTRNSSVLQRNEFIKVTQQQQNRKSVVTDVRREGVADSQTKENPASMGE